MRAPQLGGYSALDDAFDRAIHRLVPEGQNVTVLFSGGVDSSLVASGVLRYASPHLRTIGVPGSADLRDAETAAQLLALPWSGRRIGPDDVRTVLRRTGLGKVGEPLRSVLVSLALAFDPPSAGVLLLGQGADELFGGYAHFRGLSSDAAEHRRAVDWQKLRDEDWPATTDLAKAAGVRLGAPFLDPEFADLALAQRLPMVGAGALTKPLLRDWAKHRGIPAAIADRPKRAIQYGSGVSRLVGEATRS